jgi:hypothetical protein
MEPDSGPGPVLAYTIHIYAVDEMGVSAPEVHLFEPGAVPEVSGELISAPRITTLDGKPALLSQRSVAGDGFGLRLVGTIQGDRIPIRVQWTNLPEDMRHLTESEVFDDAPAKEAAPRSGGGLDIRLPAQDGRPPYRVVIEVHSGRARIGGKSDVNRGVNLRMPDIQQCYESELKPGEESFSGRLVIRFRIETDGTVSETATHESTLRQPAGDAVAECVQGVFREMRFEAREAPATVHYPFQFMSAQ